MSLSAIPLLDDLRDHLAGDATVTDLIGESLFHARADAESALPMILYRLPRLNYDPGFGSHESSGQTAEADLQVTAVDESATDTDLVASIASAADDAMRTWAPAGWNVSNLTLLNERLDAFDREGRTFQMATMTYRLTMERA